MLRFPLKLHNHHRFQYNQQWYVVDIEVGEVVQIDEVIHSILDCCETCTFHQLVEQLKHKHPKQALFEGIRKLERLAKLELVVSQIVSEPIFEKKNAVNKRIRLLALHSLDATDPYPEDSWTLLRAMSEHVEVSYALFNIQELPPVLQETDIQGFFIQTEDDHSLARHLEGLEDSHDALLLLHADSLKVLQLFEYIPLPVIMRVSGEIQGTTTITRIHGVPKAETIINTTLAVHAAMRPFDATVVDSYWLYQLSFHLLNQPEGIHFIPLPKEVSANRLPDPSVLSYLSNLFEVNLTSTLPSGASDVHHWGNVAEVFAQLLADLIRKRQICKPDLDGALRFCQRYNPVSGEVSHHAVMLSSLLKSDMSSTIMRTLSKNHTKREIECLRQVFNA